MIYSIECLPCYLNVEVLGVKGKDSLSIEHCQTLRNVISLELNKKVSLRLPNVDLWLYCKVWQVKESTNILHSISLFINEYLAITDSCFREVFYTIDHR